jgi:hypothetical protein
MHRSSREGASKVVTVFGNGLALYTEPSGAIHLQMHTGDDPSHPSHAGRRTHVVDVAAANVEIVRHGPSSDPSTGFTYRVTHKVPVDVGVTAFPLQLDDVAKPPASSAGFPVERMLMIFGNARRGAGWRTDVNGNRFWLMTCGRVPGLLSACDDGFYVVIREEDIRFGPFLQEPCFIDERIVAAYFLAPGVALTPLPWMNLDLNAAAANPGNSG